MLNDLNIIQLLHIKRPLLSGVYYRNIYEMKFLLGTKFPPGGRHRLRKIRFSDLQYSKGYVNKFEMFIK